MSSEQFNDDTVYDSAEPAPAPVDKSLPPIHRRQFLLAFTPGVIGLVCNLDDDGGPSVKPND